MTDRHPILAALDDLQALPPDWDGYGAIPIDPAILSAARDFVPAIPDSLVATTRVVPMTRGRLQFEWHRRGCMLEIEFESADRIHYLKWVADRICPEEEIIPAGDGDAIRGLFGWFTSPASG